MRAFSALEWHIAGRYLKARRQEGFVSVIAGVSFLGITLGVATLIVVMAVMTGFRSDLLDRILGVSGHASIQPVMGRFEDRDALVERLLASAQVTRVAPLVDGQAMVSTANGVRGILVRGMTPEDMARMPVLAENITQGSIDMLGRNDVLIGARLADILRLDLGDELALIAPRGSVTPFGTAPRVKRFRIAGTFALGLAEYDAAIIFMPLTAAQKFFGRGPASGVLEVSITDPDKIDTAVNSWRALLGPGDRIVTWKQTNGALSGALEVERNVMFLILTMILLVAALNIVSGLYMLVKDKGRDIAVLRSMGASSGMIMRIFFLTGASIGVVGTLTGLGLGVAFCLNIEDIRQFLIWLTGADLFPAQIYFLEELPAEIRMSDVVRVTGLALFLSFTSTLYPAWRAARLEPLEALRYE